MRFQRVSPEVFPTEGSRSVASRDRAARTGRRSADPGRARVLTVRRLLDAYRSGDFTTARSILTDDITIEYLGHDGTPVTVRGIDTLTEVALEPDRWQLNRRHFLVGEVVPHRHGALSVFEQTTPRIPVRRQLALWSFRGPRVRSIRVFVPVTGGDDPAP